MLLADEAKDDPGGVVAADMRLSIINSMYRIRSPLYCPRPHPPFAPVGLEVPFGQFHGSLESLPECELTTWEHLLQYENTCL